ncbi:MAG: hypothetical protein AB1540_08935 [Bdellovibrionota bacterium]
MFGGILTDPLAQGRGRRWERDFAGEPTELDKFYAGFLVVLSIIPAAVVAMVSVEPRWKVMADLFGAPLQAVISGFLTSTLLFLGSHVNKVPKPWTVAFKLMLRVMSVFPLLGFLSVHPWGRIISLLIYGFFVVRGVQKTYPISLQNTLLFFGVIYVVFALLQTQALLSPMAENPLQRF